MKQVLHDVRTGRTDVRELPDPIATPGHIVVATVASLISAGTERYVVDLAKRSLIGKARQRPDHVKRVLQKLRYEGLRKTVTQVRAKLDEPLALGYSAAGIVLQCGPDVQEFKPGDRVAVAAPHGGVVSASRNLSARLPDGVALEQAAYAGVGAIALHGVRLAQVDIGSRVLVIGVGLLGQIIVALLKAQGCSVFAIDLHEWKTTFARRLGADVTATTFDADAVGAFSAGRGVDAVIIAAASTDSSAVQFAAEVCRVRGRVISVGAVGLDLPRDPFFKKGIELAVSSSLGPGRGDPAYEEKGIDYPVGFVRWTAQRNMEAVLDVIASGKLPVQMLTTHTFDVERAADAYKLITEGSEQSFGVMLRYGVAPDTPRRTMTLRQGGVVPHGQLAISVIGTGNFARLVLLPELAKRKDVSWRVVCAAKGVSAEQTARKFGFDVVATDAAATWADAATRAVFVLTRHNLHAEQVIAALREGKHVFVEKPLCITPDELHEIDTIVRQLGERCPLLMVGYNRRFSRAVAAVREFFSGITPLTISFRLAPGYIAPSHWTQDPETGGGRIIGEATHAVDTCTAIAGAPVYDVYARSVGKRGGIETTDDKAFMVLSHENGSVSQVSYQSAGDRGFPSERIEVFGGGRTAVIDNWTTVELWHGGARKKIDAHRDKGHAAELDAFIRACRAGGQWPISWDELYADTWASLMAVESLRTGVPISRDEFDK